MLRATHLGPAGCRGWERCPVVRSSPRGRRRTRWAPRAAGRVAPLPVRTRVVIQRGSAASSAATSVPPGAAPSRSVELVYRPCSRMLAALARPDDDLALRADRDVLDAVLVRLRAQHERRVADPGQERADD